MVVLAVAVAAIAPVSAPPLGLPVPAAVRAIVEAAPSLGEAPRAEDALGAPVAGRRGQAVVDVAAEAHRHAADDSVGLGAVVVTTAGAVRGEVARGRRRRAHRVDGVGARTAPVRVRDPRLEARPAQAAVLLLAHPFGVEIGDHGHVHEVVRGEHLLGHVGVDAELAARARVIFLKRRGVGFLFLGAAVEDALGGAGDVRDGGDGSDGLDEGLAVGELDRGARSVGLDEPTADLEDARAVAVVLLNNRRGRIGHGGDLVDALVNDSAGGLEAKVELEHLVGGGERGRNVGRAGCARLGESVSVRAHGLGVSHVGARDAVVHGLNRGRVGDLVGVVAAVVDLLDEDRVVADGALDAEFRLFGGNVEVPGTRVPRARFGVVGRDVPLGHGRNKGHDND
mmetsp:Transcript_49964/g.141194  ORF Transcript_49964/g.141194 Transcript_49964/m.141194 type:complete len:396 (+) Transcript_49964:477-1664(+)